MKMGKSGLRILVCNKQPNLMTILLIGIVTQSRKSAAKPITAAKVQAFISKHKTVPERFSCKVSNCL